MALAAAAAKDPDPLALGVRGLALGLAISMSDPGLASYTYIALNLSEAERGSLQNAGQAICDRVACDLKQTIRVERNAATGAA